MICDPVVCPPLSCPSPVQVPDQCCPVCPGECQAGVETVMGAPPMAGGMKPLGRKGGVTLCPHYFLAPQRNKMSETCPGCRGAGTPERVSWQCMSQGGEPRGTAGWDQEGDGRVRAEMGG